jgi:hypothetical protein
VRGRYVLFVGFAGLLASLFSGCLDATEAPSPEPGSEACQRTAFDTAVTRLTTPREDPIQDDKDLMWDHDSYDVRTCSLPAIGRHPLNATGTPHGYIGEMDSKAAFNLSAVAVVGNHEPPRVYLLDISDRAHPVVLATIDQADTYIVDVKISDDAKVLYTASQNDPTLELIDQLPTPTAPDGFSVYNIENRKAPRYLGTIVDSAGGCHMLSTVQVAAGQDAVFCVSQHVRSYLVDRSGDRLVTAGYVEYVPTDENGVPIPAAPPRPPGPVPNVAFPEALPFASGPHDMTVFHEGGVFRAGRSYMVVSHWEEGVRVLDITDAPAVTEVGVWRGEGATHYSGNVHTAMMFTVADHRYIMASPELTNSTAVEVPSLWVLNADDLSNLKLVGEWYHPNQHPAQGLYLTTHQWQVAPTGPDVAPEDVRVYLTYNHAGVWVLDFSQLLKKDLWSAILGYNSARRPIEQETSVANAVLSTWDINVVDGYIYGTDRATGLWIFHYEDDELGNPRLTGFA